jgi:hypothetical protein
MSNILKKIGYFIIIVACIAFARVVTKFLVKGSFSSSSSLTYEDSLKVYLNYFPLIQDSLNKKPQALLDDFTSFDSINCSSELNEITYYHTLVQNNKSDLDLDFFNKAIKSRLDSTTKLNPNMAMQRRFKTKLYYVYFDKNCDFVTKVNAEY